MTALIGSAFGAAAGLGLWLIVTGLRGVEATPQRSRRWWPLPAGAIRVDKTGLRVLLVVVGFGVGLAATGWVAAGLLVGAAATTVPTLIGSKARREARVARSEAVASWTEMVRDTMAAGAHLQSAVAAAARTPPAPIAAEVTALAARVERDRLEVALRRFATEVADPTADLVVASLLLALRARAKDLESVLGAAASSARAQVAMRRKVEAGRARARQGLRLILAVSVAWAAWAVVAWRDYMTPFATAQGQVVLLVVGVIFAAAIVAMERLGREGQRERILRSEGGAWRW